MPLTHASHVLLITGPPGVGKTTIVRNVAASLTGLQAAGFYTDEIRVAGERQGFRAVTFDGQAQVMAHVDFGGPHRVGKYGVDIAVIDGLAESALAVTPDTGLYFVDEIGRMECLSHRFMAAMRGLLDSPKLLIATIGQRGGGFIAAVKERSDAELWKVTRENRDEVSARALDWLATHR